MRHAFRQLAKSPGFAVLAIITLALGIGLNTSMFSLMNLLLLQPLPFPDKQHLVRISRTTPQTRTAGFTAPDYLELTRALTNVSHVAGFRPWSFSLALPDRPPVNLNALRVAPEFFGTVGLNPELGRYFTADEDKPGNHVVVLSHATWQAQFGGDPSVVGRTVRIDGEPTTVVGVAPIALANLFLWGPGDAFRPLALTKDERADRRDAGLSVIARLNPDITVGAFNGQLVSTAQELAKARPREQSQDGLLAVPLQSTVRNTFSVSLSWLLVGLAGFVLFIACANLANLQLARAITRAQEFAVRAALGASRFRLLQPMLAESLLLALAGGVLGVLVCAWANDWLSSQLSANGVVTIHVGLDWRVLAFTIGVSVVTGVIFGLAPAFVLSHIRVNDALKTGTRGNTGGRIHSRVRHALIVGQFALALVLLATAGLFIHAFNSVLTRDVGWDPHSVVQGVVALPESKYGTPEKKVAFYTQLQERLGGLPGVDQRVAVGWTIPLFQYLNSRNFIVEGREAPPAGREPLGFVNGVTPSYLATLKINLLAGRNFTPTDDLRSEPVVIINASMARALFPDEDPIGRRIGTTDPANRGWAKIVGVVPDVRFLVSFGTPATRFLVLKPIAQEPWGYVTFAVRGPAASHLADSIRRAIATLDPDLPVQQLNTIEDLLRSGSGGFPLIGTLLTSFAALGLFLAALGLYGVIARVVAQRMPELGVRVALGAQARDVVWLILRAGLRLTLAGTIIGLIGAFALTFVFSKATPELPVQDPIVIGEVTLLLVAVALVASWVPAQRASRVDPAIALRTD